MRELGAALKEHLLSGETTLAWCWLILREDGTLMGFTNHDRDLSLTGLVIPGTATTSLTFEASTGFLASEVESNLGLSVDNMDVEGAVDSVRITESDIYTGLYDNAHVDLYLVNWEAVSQRVLMKRGNIGEVARGTTFFKAELRGLSAIMQQKKGRIFQYTCDADLGDTRCGINLASSTYKGSGTVSSASSSAGLIVTGLDSYATEWFTRGNLTFTSGQNSGLSYEVKSHRKSASETVMVLWTPTAFDVSAADTFTVTAGCNKLFKTCKAKFANQNSFRGFPHMPTNDFVLAYPNTGDAGMDGGGNFVGAD